MYNHVCRNDTSGCTLALAVSFLLQLQDARSDIEDSEKEDEHHVNETRKKPSQMNGTK